MLYLVEHFLFRIAINYIIQLFYIYFFNLKNINLQPKIEDIFNMIRIYNIKNYFLLLVVSFTFSFQSLAEVDGAQIFKQNCTACHVLGETKLIGPGLKGITEKRDKEWLKKWINNSSELIASGDADAIAIFEEYNKVVMTNFSIFGSKR